MESHGHLCPRWRHTYWNWNDTEISVVPAQGWHADLWNVPWFRWLARLTVVIIFVIQISTHYVVCLRLIQCGMSIIRQLKKKKSWVLLELLVDIAEGLDPFIYLSADDQIFNFTASSPILELTFKTRKIMSSGLNFHILVNFDSVPVFIGYFFSYKLNVCVQFIFLSCLHHLRQLGPNTER